MSYIAAKICPTCRRIPRFADVWCPCGERLLPEGPHPRSPYLWPGHVARQHPLAGERRMIRRAWRKE
jgi:hypothetical protein